MIAAILGRTRGGAIRGLRWWMIGLIMLGAVVNYLTRSSLAVAAPTLLAELEITAREYSYITAAFQGAIMLQPLCGYVLDVIGLKYGFAIFAMKTPSGTAKTAQIAVTASAMPRVRRAVVT